MIQSLSNLPEPTIKDVFGGTSANRFAGSPHTVAALPPCCAKCWERTFG